MKVLILVIICILIAMLFFTCGGDKHPEYPEVYELADKVEKIQCISESDSNNRNHYKLFALDGQPLYEFKHTFYNLYGDSVAHYNFSKMLPHGYNLTGEQALTGQYICKEHFDDASFSLFNLITEEIEHKVNIISSDIFSSLLDTSGGPGQNDLAYDLEDIGFIFPTSLDKRPLRGNFKDRKDYDKAETEYKAALVIQYQKSVNDFINKNKGVIYLYKSYYSSLLRRFQPCLVFPEKNIAFSIEGSIKSEGFPSYLKGTVKLRTKIDNPAIAFNEKGKSYIGTRMAGGFIPTPKSYYMYYYQLVCDGETIHFKNPQEVTLYDFDQTDEKIYFALEVNEKIKLFEYMRK